MKQLSNIRRLLTLGQNDFQRRLSRQLIDTAVSDYQVWLRTMGEAGGLREMLRPIYGYATDKSGREPLPDELALAIDLFEFLLQSLQQIQDQQSERREAFAVFQRIYPRAPSDSERRRLILDLAARLGATPRGLKADADAFERWFGFDTIVERYHRRFGENEQWMEFVLTALGRLSVPLLSAATSAESRLAVWRQLEWDHIYTKTMTGPRNFRVTVALHQGLLNAVQELGKVSQDSVLDRTVLRSISNLSLDRSQNVWVQASALSLLAQEMPREFRRTAENRLTIPQSGDDLFVRRRVIELLATHRQSVTDREDLILAAAWDPSPFVRQAVARALASSLSSGASRAVLHRMITTDSEPSVRAAVLVETGLADEQCEHSEWFIMCMRDVLGHEFNNFVIRTALWVIAERIERLAFRGTVEQLRHAENLGAALMRGMRTLQEKAESLPVRRWAAQSAERVCVSLNPEAREVRQLLERQVRDLDPNRSVRLSWQVLQKYDEQIVGRVLAVFAQEDYGYDIEDGWWSLVVRRGSHFRLRLWRLWHELRHPSPDKRQAFRHTVGRVSYANLRVPSGILGELSPTRVPGEPLYLPDDNSWRPYLPLVDDVLSSLNQWIVVRRVQFFTADGVTSLKPPRFWLSRIQAWMKLTFGFHKYAKLRNWTPGTDSPPHSYVNSLRELGFQIDFQPHFDEAGRPVAVDHSVHRFFNDVSAKSFTPPAGGVARRESKSPDHALKEHAATSAPAVAAQAAILALVDMPRAGESVLRWFDDYARYFMSVYENSVAQLLIFVTIVFTLFFLRQFWLTRAVRRAGKKLCLTVGGWGTRGKSGTERLKAALFNALGFGLVSKSTGCEAMFLHGSTYGELRELILYRPYDKATIWEHAAVMGIAGRLGVPVFLWECMGLNPAYVNVLQHQWSQDDLSTITNAYPDHEDIQGPAGINVAESISSFIPDRSTLFTTEFQMYPVLRNQARRLGTAVHKAGWLESGMLTPDVLTRFPYMEHPENIALTVMLARALGCEADFALREMADRLVPDLGVLTTFPPSSIRTRSLEFSNGMSANERHGCLNNWIRLGFDQHDPELEPGTWITTVVNNRADRIARSRVFATMLIHDLPADRHFLIGGNLKGLLGYVRDAWDEWVANVTLQLRDDVNPVSCALTNLKKMAHRFRVTTEETQVHRILEVMLRGAAETIPDVPAEVLLIELLPLWNEPEQIAGHLATHGVDESLIRDLRQNLQDAIQTSTEFQNFVERLQTATPEELRQDAKAMDEEFRSLLWRWFERKLVVVEDYYASGEQIIDLIATHTPPGFRNRIMGIQNIKGTGLDFVYRWIAWQVCVDACNQLFSSDHDIFQRGLRLLGDFREFGQLSEARIRETLQEARNLPHAQREDVLAQLQLIQSNFESELKRVRQQFTVTKTKATGFSRLNTWLEEFMDATDAVRRRRAADLIYRDLADERISRDRAVLELRNLTQRQKGGWFRKRGSHVS